MVFLNLLCSFVFAQVGATADSLGGAGIGGPHAYESAILNPAALVDLKKQYMGFQTINTDIADDIKQRNHSFFVTDAGEETLFPGTLFYRNRSNKFLGERIREEHFQLSVAGAIARTMSVGVSAYKIRTNMPSGSDYNQYNADIGGYWFVQDSLSLGAVFRGVLGSKDSLAWSPSQVIPSTGLGAEFRFLEMFRFRYDINYFFEQNPDKRYRHQIGGEVRYESALVLRTGFSQDDRLAQNRWTVGIGWEGPRLKVAYAYQNELRQDFGDTHSVDMWLDF
jgi:hypothetical protein